MTYYFTRSFWVITDQKRELLVAKEGDPGEERICILTDNDAEEWQRSGNKTSLFLAKENEIRLLAESLKTKDYLRYLPFVSKGAEKYLRKNYSHNKELMKELRNITRNNEGGIIKSIIENPHVIMKILIPMEVKLELRPLGRRTLIRID